MTLDRRGWQLVALCAAWVASCGVAFWLVYLVTVRTSYGRLFADASLRGAVLSRSRLSDAIEGTLGVITVAFLLAALALITVIALLRLRRALGVAAAGVLILSNVSAQLLKSFVLERPDLGLRESVPATLNSLPGGHSTAAFSVAVALLLVVPARTRGLVALAGGAYSILVALATMVAGWHRASDSVAAFLLVGLWAGVAVGAIVVFGARDEGEELSPAARAGHRSLLAAAILVLGLGGVLMATLAMVDSVRESTVGEVIAFATGGLFIMGAAISVLLGALALIERIAPSAGRTAASFGAPT